MKTLFDHTRWGLGLIAFVCLVLLGSCQKNEMGEGYAMEQLLEFESLKHLNECDVNIVDNENIDRFLIINSQEELKTYVLFNNVEQSPCDQLKNELNVDFSESTMLIGKKQLSLIEGELVKQEVVAFDEELVYKVRIRRGGYTAIGQFRFGIIIPKVSKDINVKFDVSVE